jgi:DNA phosphorothioation-associated putative methyltransferase
MDADVNWRAICDAHAHGKRVGDSWYVHRSALADEAGREVDKVSAVVGCRGRFDVLKVSARRGVVSFLSYPGFFEQAFPVLREAWSFNQATGRVSHRSYATDSNPPLIHRKELLLRHDDPRCDEYRSLTRSAEEAGLFADTSIIGHRMQWEEELRSKALRVVGHGFASVESEVRPTEPVSVQRHRTALGRSGLSTPVQALWRSGFLGGGLSFFDYGCGRGDDMAAMRERGLEVGGWDPHFRPDGEKRVAEVVNLGFVINVIEDVAERRQALLGAWKHTGKVLAVAALIGGRTAYERFRLFRDGVLTSLGTFQKYYTHEELGEYIAGVVGREPISVEPGCYFVFRSDADEQDFLVRRQSMRLRPAFGPPKPPKVSRAVTTRSTSARPMRRPTKNRWDLHAELAELFWNRCLELARLPSEGELPELGRVKSCLGNPKRALEHLLAERGQGALEIARTERRDDLLVFLALNLFERRRSFRALSERLQLDIREHLGSYGAGVDAAKALLFSISDTSRIEAACVEASGRGCGHLEPGDALFIDARFINNLPSILRAYVGCAGKLYGDARSADVVKIHIRSGKVTFLIHDDYLGLDEPKLIERVKVDLRKRLVHYFQYGTEEFPALPTLGKSRFMMNPPIPLPDIVEAPAVSSDEVVTQ